MAAATLGWPHRLSGASGDVYRGTFCFLSYKLAASKPLLYAEPLQANFMSRTVSRICKRGKQKQK